MSYKFVFDTFYNYDNLSIGRCNSLQCGRCLKASKNKFIRHTFSDTLLCIYKIIKNNIFFRPVTENIYLFQKPVSDVTKASICHLIVLRPEIIAHTRRIKKSTSNIQSCQY